MVRLTLSFNEYIDFILDNEIYGFNQSFKIDVNQHLAEFILIFESEEDMLMFKLKYSI